MTTTLNYVTQDVVITAIGQQAVFAGFFDDDDAPTKYYMIHDVHNVRTNIKLSHIDLATDTVVGTETLITTTTSGSLWSAGTNFSGCYCPYNGAIVVALPEKLVIWDGSTATTLETSAKNRFMTRTYASEPQYLYVFSDTMDVQKWDLATNTLTSELTQAWVPASPIRFADYLDDGTAWLMTKAGDIYKGTWSKTGLMTMSTDYAVVYTNAATLVTTSAFTHYAFRYSAPNDTLVIADNIGLSGALLYTYDVQGGTLTLQIDEGSTGSLTRWPTVNVDSTTGNVFFNALFGGKVYDCPPIYFAPVLTMTVSVLTAMAVWPAVGGAIAYRFTYTPSGGSETTVVSSTTDLLVTATGLIPETTYDFNMYSSTDGVVFTLVGTVTEATGANVQENYNITEFLSGGEYDLTTLTTANLAVVSAVLNLLFTTDDIIVVPVNGKATTAKFINAGATGTIEDATALILPFDSTLGASQTLNLTYSDNITTAGVAYNQTLNTITIEAGTYTAGDSFILDGRKSTVVSL